MAPRERPTHDAIEGKDGRKHNSGAMKTEIEDYGTLENKKRRKTDGAKHAPANHENAVRNQTRRLGKKKTKCSKISRTVKMTLDPKGRSISREEKNSYLLARAVRSLRKKKLKRGGVIISGKKWTGVRNKRGSCHPPERTSQTC